MRTFPIKDEAYKSGNFHSYYYQRELPKFNYGEKLYIEYEGRIRAAIPIYTAYVAIAKPTQSRYDAILVCFDIAGYGKRTFDFSHHDWPKMFLSIPDYERYIKGFDDAKYSPTSVSIEDILIQHGYTRFQKSSCWQRSISGWTYNKDEPQECWLPFKDLWLDSDGSHITVIMQGWGKPEFQAYMTREECLSANRKDVVEFEDVETKKENEYIDQYGNPYGEASWPAGGGLHKDCDYNADALYAFYTIKNREDIGRYLYDRGFSIDERRKDYDAYRKGNTLVVFEGYAAEAGLYGYVHTEYVE